MHHHPRLQLQPATQQTERIQPTSADAVNRSDAQKFRYAVGKMIAVLGIQPYSVVEDKGFKSLVQLYKSFDVTFCVSENFMITWRVALFLCDS